jgi:AcrR family transcriptional regulator
VERAAELFAEHGIAATSLDEVLAAAAAGKGQFYHYFRGRDELVEAAVGLRCAQVLAGLTQALGSMSSLAELEQALAGFAAGFEQMGLPGCPIGTLAAEVAGLIAVSTASMGPADNVMGTAPRLLFRIFRTVVVPNLGRVGKDLRALEDELAASGLDWYALRPVKLTDGPLTGNVRASEQFAMKTISRADVAGHIVALAEHPGPGGLRTPVVTTGASRKSRRAVPRDQEIAAQQAPAAR